MMNNEKDNESEEIKRHRARNYEAVTRGAHSLSGSLWI